MIINPGFLPFDTCEVISWHGSYRGRHWCLWAKLRDGTMRFITCKNNSVQMLEFIDKIKYEGYDYYEDRKKTL